MEYVSDFVAHHSRMPAKIMLETSTCIHECSMWEYSPCLVYRHVDVSYGDAVGTALGLSFSHVIHHGEASKVQVNRVRYWSPRPSTLAVTPHKNQRVVCPGHLDNLHPGETEDLSLARNI